MGIGATEQVVRLGLRFLWLEPLHDDTVSTFTIVRISNIIRELNNPPHTTNKTMSLLLLACAHSALALFRVILTDYQNLKEISYPRENFVQAFHVHI